MSEQDNGTRVGFPDLMHESKSQLKFDSFDSDEVRTLYIPGVDAVGPH